MAGTFVYTTLLTIIILVCLYLLYIRQVDEQEANIITATTDDSASITENNNNLTLTIGQYTFIPSKNELHGFGETIQLNKKENAILYRLSSACGNVIERNLLLNENWGRNGIIYSRSLDTYITTLRKYLKKEPSVQIITVKGIGYKLVQS